MQLLFLLAQTVTDFADAFQIGIIHCHHCIVRNFQFRKFLPVSSNYMLPAPFSQLLENPSVFSRSFLNVSTSVESSAIRASVMRLTGAEMLRA